MTRCSRERPVVPGNVRALGAEPALGAELAEGARSLISVASRTEDVEAVLGPFDEALDALLIPAAALASYGSNDGLRHVRLAVAFLTSAATGPYGQVDPVREAILARVLRVLVGIALSHDRPETVLALVGLTHGEAPSSPPPAYDT